jgi:hypothetical protein
VTALDPGAFESAPRTSHRLQLPRDTAPEAVLTMVRNVIPEAEAEADGSIHLGEDTYLLPDTGPRGAGRWDLDVPQVREDPPTPGLDDSHGYSRAFPEGLPFGPERSALDLAWSLGRRLHGAVVTDSGVRLEPHPCHVRDLTVVSSHALAPESFAQLIAPLEPEAELDRVPEDAPRSGYSLSIPLPGEDLISVRVGLSSRPVALRAVSWLEDAVDYEIVHLPLDEAEGEVEQPDEGTSARWGAVYGRIGLIAGAIQEAVGGYIVDLEGFLVDPRDLIQ